MDKLAAGIALGVILFVTIVVGVLIVKGHRAPAPREEAMSSQADQALKEVHLQEDAKSGSYRWSLDAERAESLPDSGKTSLWKVTIGVQDVDRSWKATSDEGDLIKDTRDVELRGNVVLVSSEGLRVETTVLRWNNAEGRAWTDQPVKIYKGGGVVTGFGLDARPAEEVTFVRGRVKATFGLSKETAAPTSSVPPKLPKGPGARSSGAKASGPSAGEPVGKGKP
jgi:LPS export ABC transporter protein LptC